ncbi:nitrite reductase large subunit NirB [Chimaeribacter arupi]|uniref:Nitrite reductase (NAD(P)H) n=1 Tax=Chimaeribacter arupi TaxID=2060066 RepID=A0A2N5EJN0_9GAMM|nr:nitrite reductase large subunit NirB [Chimaeribacter arupi]PLR45950.1 nitrite reductase (NAD(P)H) [Chimaeribacter arupi]WKZ93037.1 nitrite reductase large subunit NirB [Chimaeribacter arupi]
MSKVRLAVIGNGMVGHRFIEELMEKAQPGQFEIIVFCEEPRLAYDRVHLSSYFSHHTAEELSLVREGFYEKHNIQVLVGERAITINRQEKVIHSTSGRTVWYDKLVMATGSYPWIPAIQGADTQDCFVYRTIEDLNAIEACARRSKRGAVVGGGLLGLEAAGALKNLGVETHVVEFAPVLMAEQLDRMGGEQLRQKIERMGVQVHTGKNTQLITDQGREARKTMQFADGSALEVDFIVFSTGIRPQDKLARQCGLAIGARGGIAINDSCQSSDPDVYAIGECAAWQDRVFGLVAPGYKMAQVAADSLLGRENAFGGADMSAKLKLLGVDVGGIGDAHGRTPGARSYVYLDESKEVYKRLVVSADNSTLLGAVLVGDTSDYGNLLQLALNQITLPEHPDALILPAHAGSGKPALGVDSLPETAQICSCFDVSKGDIIRAVQGGCHTVAAIKAETKAGTGCGGCIPLVTQVLNAELSKQGIEVNHHLCEHFAYSRQELYHLIRVEGITSFDALREKYGKGYGCEICKPTVGSLLASSWNEYVLAPQHTPLQDSNDIFLGNIQKDGTYSVIPRSPGGEITPEGLLAIGEVARKYHLYTKITGSQRIALFGAQKDDLPAIWQTLIDAGFETGHAYAKALRMAKTCVGSTWCRFGVGDSVGFGVELENRYKGIRTPHKMKFGVSGCTRECAEAQGKDVGIIATEKGWNLYVCGNGGMKPRHADLLAADLDRETLVRYLDRFMMFYIRTADKLQRTSLWLESLEGGIAYLRSVIIDDKLGLNAQLEAEIAQLQARVVCEWQETLAHPEQLSRFAHFINSPQRDPNVQVVPERDQHRPARPEERIPVRLVAAPEQEMEVNP